MVHLTINQHWLRWCLSTEQVTSHYLKHNGLIYICILATWHGWTQLLWLNFNFGNIGIYLHSFIISQHQVRRGLWYRSLKSMKDSVFTCSISIIWLLKSWWLCYKFNSSVIFQPQQQKGCYAIMGDCFTIITLMHEQFDCSSVLTLWGS